MATGALKQLGDAAEEAWQAFQGDVRAKLGELQGGPSMWGSLKSFAAAVTWTETWIMCLTAVEMLLLTAVLFKHNSETVTATIFAFIVIIVANLENINSLAVRHWELFAGQNYFDEHGVFVGAVLGVPLLLIMLVILVRYLLQLAGLLVIMKRKQLQAEYRKRMATSKVD